MGRQLGRQNICARACLGNLAREAIQNFRPLASTGHSPPNLSPISLRTLPYLFLFRSERWRRLPSSSSTPLPQIELRPDVEEGLAAQMWRKGLAAPSICMHEACELHPEVEDMVRGLLSVRV